MSCPFTKCAKFIVRYQTIQSLVPSSPGWTFPAFVLMGIANIICAVALFQWKKWAFWGVVTITIVGFIISLSTGFSVFHAALGFLSVAILYGVLQIGGENKGWTQLE
jgi:uncharacterized membrane protein